MITASRQHTLGFTLIELMVTLTVLSIVIAIGIPSFRDSIAKSNVTAEANRIIAGINFARSQAVSKGQVVTLAQNSATPNDWSQGWAVYSDFIAGTTNNGAGNTAYEAGGDDETGDVLLKTFNSNTSHMTVRANDQAAQFISFNSSGRLIPGGAIIIAVCDSNLTSSIPGRSIDINRIGRTTVTVIAADDANKAARCTP